MYIDKMDNVLKLDCPQKNKYEQKQMKRSSNSINNDKTLFKQLCHTF